MGPAALTPFVNAASANIHGSCVAMDARGLLILGSSGTGKSALALEMMALGAVLVADDRVDLARDGDEVIATAPAPIAGLIEARGIGLLSADAIGPVPLRYILDLDRTETARLPDPQRCTVLGCQIPLLGAPIAPHLAAALMQLLKAGRVAPEWPGK